MPGIVRKLLVVAAVDALFLQPHVHRTQQPVQGVQISYGKAEIRAATTTFPSHGTSSPHLEAHGIVGTFTVATSSYLIVITGRRQVAQICGNPIYVITGVTLIPLSSFSEARLAIENYRKALERSEGSQAGIAPDSDTSEDELFHAEHAATADTEDDVPSPARERVSRSTSKEAPSVVQDVISKKGAYGRFAERWFSKKGWSVERRKSQGMSADASEPRKALGVADDDNSDSSAKISTERDSEALEMIEPKQEQGSDIVAKLIPKLLRTTRLLLNSQSFYYSYDHDITHRIGSQQSNSGDVPLHRRVDTLFFWNRHLISSFAEAGHDQFVLPLMQGFIKQHAFTIDTSQNCITDSMSNIGEVIELQDNAADSELFKASSHVRNFLVTLISRRSIGRPGLRYLRRGVDDDGNTANFVETEQIVSEPSWSPSSRVYSFTQIRGSIPLFFSQSPYSLKPSPVIKHSFETNQTAFRRHFSAVASRYGQTQVALLVDKHGTEAKIGDQYEKHAKNINANGGINSQKIGFEWFDFHYVCRGMKFENVSILIDTLDAVLQSYDCSVEVDGKLTRSQSGILRTSCMDCLDRTNVVQSACGRWALQRQLSEEGVSLDLQGDSSTRWFDILWADNGDAISQQYASTAALKGDYTRTRKRDYRGALNDFGLTLGRYYNNIVNDFFSQAAIDFLLGRVSDEVFEEFEANMMSGDPGMSMSKVRQNAVDISVKIVVEDRTEEFRGGWAMITPHASNSLRTFPMEEMVLLLTDVALYAVRFNWATEKVSAFERVDLRDVTRIYRGTYITSTLSTFQSDAKRNVGLVVQYRVGKQQPVARVNTRSMSTSADLPKASQEEQSSTKGAENKLPGHAPSSQAESSETGGVLAGDAGVETKSSNEEIRILAFKAIPAHLGPKGSSQKPPQAQELSETELVKTICEEIARSATKKLEDLVEEKDIISLAEAKKSTGLIEQWGHSLKKLVWA